MRAGIGSIGWGKAADVQRVVAIVDDDEGVRRSTAALLERAGYRVRAFESGDAYLAAQFPGDSDCLLLDLRMPGTGGLEILRMVGAWETMPAVLVMTGHGDVREAVAAMKLGAVDFLEKPCPAEILLDVIDKALESRTAAKGGAVDAHAAAKVGRLSHRQKQVLRGMLKGQPNKVIAYGLGLSIRTVEAYRAQLLEKLAVRSTAEAIRLAIGAGMLED